MKKVIITGTKGFIGSNLMKSLDLAFDIIEINEDIFNSVSWKDELTKHFWLDIHAVFHVGACSDTLETDVNYMMLLNYEFTKHLTDLCSVKKIPIIYSSSAANYGINNDYPSNLYGWSKYVAEDYVISKGGIALRYFNVYGPGEEKKGRMSSVAYQMFIKNKNKEEIKLFPKKPTRDFVYIKDVIESNLFALEHFNDLNGKYYEVGSGESRLFEDVLNIMGIDFSYHNDNIIPEGYQFYTCSDKSKWMSNWLPKCNLEKGINDYKKYL